MSPEHATASHCLLISLIGNPHGDYDSATYLLDDGTQHTGSYHQDALLRRLFPALPVGSANPRFWLVSTEKALEKHADRLSQKPRRIAVPDGSSDDDFWKIYAAIADPLLELADQTTAGSPQPIDIHIDLTHGWRVLPTFLLSAVRACCALRPKRLRLADIWYAFYVPKHPAPPGGWPLRRVTPIAIMADLAADVRFFLDYGIGGPLKGRLEQAKRALVPQLVQRAQALRAAGDPRPEGAIIGELRRQDPDLSAIPELAHAMAQMMSTAQLNHTPHLPHAVDDLCQSVSRLSPAAIVMRPLFEALDTLAHELRQMMPSARQPLWRWHLACARWCLERGWLQQAVTHAAELTVTRLCEERGLDPCDHQQRHAIARVLSAFDQRPIADRVRNQQLHLPAPWADLLSANRTLFKQVRNLINHAGMNRDGASCDPARLETNLGQSVRNILTLHEREPGPLPWDQLMEALDVVAVVPAREAWPLLAEPIAAWDPHLQLSWAYLPRVLVEDDPAHLQVIPYAVLQAPDGRLWAARRTGGDPRLQGLGTIGLGGHIAYADQAETLVGSARKALLRELAEELHNPPPVATVADTPRAWISEGRTLIGRVHIGLLWVIPWTAAEPPRPTERSHLEPIGFLDPARIVEDDGFEIWSCLARQAAAP
ncbi:MAG: TM1812 family CRISPR-associated protein [Burkholderiales bacterium]|nr:TM1812 family CRISPR-associated protein [Burkholderiales bacterium]